MDESHRYRASAGVRAINELKPILGLELTATPFVEGTAKSGPVPFKNVVFDYPLGRAITDGFVKKPAVVTRKDFNDKGMTPDAVEQLKLEDGVSLHETVKVELATYASETGQRFVKPFVLVIARDTTHAAKLKSLIQSDAFFEGRYRDKVIQVDSSGSGVERDENVERLLKVEDPAEPTEIVIHVEKLKEGWDVTNLYTIEHLRRPEVQAAIVARVQASRPPGQLALEGVASVVDVAAVVARTIDVVVKGTIGIPRILLVPKALRCGFDRFAIDFRTMHYAPVSEELWIQHLSGTEFAIVAIHAGGVAEKRLEDYVVRSLVDFNDISYDDHAVLLQDLAGQVVAHLTSYLSELEAQRVLQVHERDIARFVHAQMQQHYWEKHEGYDVDIRRGFEELRRSAYSVPVGEDVRDFRHAPEDRSRIARYLFGAFARCLYPVQKFQSDTERLMAVILDRESVRWFKPAKDQMRIEYRDGHDRVSYVPDFVAETAEEFLVLETKARNEIDDPVVVEKARVAREWCGHASEHARQHGTKPWRYALIPHDVVAENMSVAALVR